MYTSGLLGTGSYTPAQLHRNQPGAICVSGKTSTDGILAKLRKPPE